MLDQHIPHFTPARHSLFVLFFLAFTLSACSFFQEDSPASKPVARAFDKYLYEDDIRDMVPLGTSSEDSAKLVRSYLESWVKQQLILNKAKLNLTQQNTFSNIEKQLDDYRTSLVIYAYQKELIKQKLDTLISPAEIHEYYRENANNLILRDDIVRALYIKVAKGAPNLDSARAWCVSDVEEDRLALEEYCHQYAKSFLLKDEEWVLYQNLELELGRTLDLGEDEFETERMIELEDSMNVFLIYVINLIRKDNPAPVEYERKKIRDILLNRRRSELIANMETSTYQDGVSKNYFELYE